MKKELENLKKQSKEYESNKNIQLGELKSLQESNNVFNSNIEKFMYKILEVNKDENK